MWCVEAVHVRCPPLDNLTSTTRLSLRGHDKGGQIHHGQAFKLATLKAIIDCVYSQQPTIARNSLSAVPEMRMKGELVLRRVCRRAEGHVVFLPAMYRMLQGSSGPEGPPMYDEFEAALADVGVQVTDHPIPGIPKVLILCPGVFGNGQFVKDATSDLQMQNAQPLTQRTVRLESPLVRFAWPHIQFLHDLDPIF